MCSLRQIRYRPNCFSSFDGLLNICIRHSNNLFCSACSDYCIFAAIYVHRLCLNTLLISLFLSLFFYGEIIHVHFSTGWNSFIYFTVHLMWFLFSIFIQNENFCQFDQTNAAIEDFPNWPMLPNLDNWSTFIRK